MGKQNQIKCYNLEQYIGNLKGQLEICQTECALLHNAIHDFVAIFWMDLGFCYFCFMESTKSNFQTILKLCCCYMQI